MKISYSFHIFYLQKYGGISNYFANLGKHLIKQGIDIQFNCPIHKNNNLKYIPKKFVNGFKIPFPYPINFFIEKINYSIIEKQYKYSLPDIVHNTYFNKKLRKNENFKNILNFWDMTHELFDKKNNFINLKKKNLHECDAIICPSRTVKEDLIEYYKIEENKIFVTYFSSDFEKQYSENKKLNDYILYVGSRSNYKNFENFIKSFSLSDKLKKNYKLLIFGGENQNVFGKKILDKYGINKELFKFVRGSNEELKNIYKNVRLFVYPSHYEGFGIPLIEAMRSGCPIISSSGGALKEIGGDGLNYFHPNDTEELKHLMEDLIFDDYKIKKTIEYGYNRSEKFSWKNCASETREIYKSLL